MIVIGWSQGVGLKIVFDLEFSTGQNKACLRLDKIGWIACPLRSIDKLVFVFLYIFKNPPSLI